MLDVDVVLGISCVARRTGLVHHINGFDAACDTAPLLVPGLIRAGYRCIADRGDAASRVEAW
jgi:hypothetical protein